MGKPFTVFSDHKPLENLNIKSRRHEELGELSYYLSQYDFIIKYMPGKNNLEADCLSRNPVLNAEENRKNILKIVNLITLNDIITDQQENNELQNKLINMIKKNNVYYEKKNKKERIVLSENYSKKFIKEVHEEYCHIGIKQMENKITPYYTANNLKNNMKNICKCCEICIKNKSRGQMKYGLMSFLGPSKEPFEIMSIDTIGGFGGSRSTKKYLHLLVDHFTRYAYIRTSQTQNANDFIQLIKKVTDNNKKK